MYNILELLNLLKICLFIFCNVTLFFILIDIDVELVRHELFALPPKNSFKKQFKLEMKYALSIS